METQSRVKLPHEKYQAERERMGILRQLEHWLEAPMIILGLVWLVLLVVDLTGNSGPWSNRATNLIWAVFWIEFILKFVLAPRKYAFLQRNWLTLLGLAVPALRIFRLARLLRVFRLFRAVRTLRLVRVLSSLNRGMRVLGRTMRRRGFSYVLTLTLVVTFVGAAGMLAFERENGDGQNLPDYGTALWWTAMLLTTMGSEFWPQTPEGRALCLILAMYAFTVFGYVTATLASYFIDRDQARKSNSGEAVLRQLHAEIVGLRAEVSRLREPARQPQSTT